MGSSIPLHSTLSVFTFSAVLETQDLSKPLVLLSIIVAFLAITIHTWVFTRGGLAWKNGRNQMGRESIPGPRGLPFFGSIFSLSYGLAHRTLVRMASNHAATKLMAFSLGSVPAIVTSDPQIAREILTSPHFADRPLKQSAKSLMFGRAIGFAPNGAYWRFLRKIASNHLFAPKRIAAHETWRQIESAIMLRAVYTEQSCHGVVYLRKHLQNASLNNIMGTVFGKRYDLVQYSEEARELLELVSEGFDLLGAFNWSDYLPWLNYIYDPFRIKERCYALVPKVKKFVKKIIEDHRMDKPKKLADNAAYFIDVLLSMEGEEKLDEEDIVAVLWEMIFRGTDTTALLTEWAMAELVLHPDIQHRLQHELDLVAGDKTVTDADVAKLPYLQAVMKETLRVHPPGPLLSWARLSTSDVPLSTGMVVPANTTAMVNMWAITHDQRIWEDAMAFKPERFLVSEGGEDIDVRGGDLRLAPFGAGRRVCPGKNLGLATASLWVAKLVHHFEWVQDEANPVDLSETLKLSCEMKKPLRAVAVPRKVVYWQQLFYPAIGVQ